MQINKLPIVEKAYELNLERIEEGYLYSQVWTRAKKNAEARVKILRENQYEGFKIKSTGEDISYTNIPLKRMPSHDVVMFENEHIARYEVARAIKRKERIEELKAIEDNESIKFCYIRKRGQYYRPFSNGYTDFISKAGIYSKGEAISHAKGCDDLTLVPINVEDHNKMINEQIEDLQSRIIDTKK